MNGVNKPTIMFSGILGRLILLPDKTFLFIPFPRCTKDDTLVLCENLAKDPDLIEFI
jgi:hypothetical protein